MEGSPSNQQRRQWVVHVLDSLEIRHTVTKVYIHALAEKQLPGGN